MTARPFVIAEAGVNHNGDCGRAHAMIEAAKAAAADAVKFQAFDPIELVSQGALTAPYQAANTGLENQHALLTDLALNADQFAELADHCAELDIEFMCTAFDVPLLKRLIEMGIRKIKVASGELTNLPALRAIAEMGLPIILSTGMSTLSEVVCAVETLKTYGAAEITLLHCTSLYPAPDHTLNLRAIATMESHFGLPVGFSDHSVGDYAAAAAVALGATVIEKHFTLDKGLPGPDHSASLEPDELKTFIAKLRSISLSLGDGVKRPVAEEIETARLVRRSWHTERDLSAGEVLDSRNCRLKRPASGLSPAECPFGRTLARGLAADRPIHEHHLI